MFCTIKLCLVQASESPNTSASWKASVPISGLATCPVIATTGIESANASPKPVTKLVAPGPEVAIQTPTLPVERA